MADAGDMTRTGQGRGSLCLASRIPEEEEAGGAGRTGWVAGEVIPNLAQNSRASLWVASCWLFNRLTACSSARIRAERGAIGHKERLQKEGKGVQDTAGGSEVRERL